VDLSKHRPHWGLPSLDPARLHDVDKHLLELATRILGAVPASGGLLRRTLFLKHDHLSSFRGRVCPAGSESVARQNRDDLGWKKQLTFAGS
jgi:hypothetical protein